ncbi:phenylalanine--tRNA ligase subunit beta [Naumannella halotolerans]|uniref:Phenylalanine--tRNA ligase beta subunit n=1 Tax=Naumannella halotolerans TaxID=993414 RepID=A0A4R7J6Q2_9ACTN|nr:phenylalanine--tRNA ligase subunit beta [Naumannella halotolerans]TDT33081.1 phenylalanyl-tRNA synthetase beta chain [Naumannella halotolerans]
MRAPIGWLAEYAALGDDLDPVTLREQLINIGLEVERIDSAGADVSGPVVIGKVVSFEAEPQKNGKTIRWCAVDVGEYNQTSEITDGGPRGIVCGASNFAEGDLVAVALPGAVLPGDFAISARKTYGHVSDGMICSARELGLGDEHDGILVLSPVDDHGNPRELGTPVVDALGLREDVLDIAVTPDMSYCLSIRGIARESALANSVAFTDPAAEALPAPIAEGQSVELQTPKAPLYTMLSISGVDPSRPSPQFITRRLQLAGVRPISLIVDVTNYVMLEIGVPLHAFATDRVQGGIVVREATEGETLVTLDDKRRTLAAGDLLITDDSGPIGLAGVMGGASTEIDETTTEVLLEAAWFDPIQIGRTSRRLKLVSEASKRFERTVDPRATYAAAARAAELLTRYGGGTVTGTTIVGRAPESPRQTMDPQLPSRVLGAKIDDQWVIDTLTASGVEVTVGETGLQLRPPSWRPDLVDPFDYVEEVGAKWGVNDKIASVVPRAPGGHGLSPVQRARRAVNRAATAAGFVEVLSFPFTSAADLDKLGIAADDQRRDQVSLLNPLSELQDKLRTTVLPGLFAAVAKNTSRSQDDLALFEFGSVYFGAQRPDAPTPGVLDRPTDAELLALDAALPRQPWHFGAVLTGLWQPKGWDNPAKPAGWQQALALVDVVAASLGLRVTRRAAEYAPWHPGRCAAISVGDTLIGYAGELHPKVVQAFGLPERTAAVELDFDALIALVPGPGQVPLISPYPVVKEDVALVVDEAVPVADVEQALVQGAGELLESVRLFDIYRSEQLGEQKKSLAYSLRFRAADRTLTEAEASTARDAAVQAAAERYGAVQRA